MESNRQHEIKWRLNYGSVLTMYKFLSSSLEVSEFWCHENKNSIEQMAAKNLNTKRHLKIEMWNQRIVNESNRMVIVRSRLTENSINSYTPIAYGTLVPG